MWKRSKQVVGWSDGWSGHVLQKNVVYHYPVLLSLQTTQSRLLSPCSRRWSFLSRRTGRSHERGLPMELRRLSCCCKYSVTRLSTRDCQNQGGSFLFGSPQGRGWSCSCTTDTSSKFLHYSQFLFHKRIWHRKVIAMIHAIHAVVVVIHT